MAESRSLNLYTAHLNNINFTLIPQRCQLDEKNGHITMIFRAVSQKNGYYVITSDTLLCAAITPNSNRVYDLSTNRNLDLKDAIDLDITNVHTIEVLLGGKESEMWIMKMAIDRKRDEDYRAEKAKKRAAYREFLLNLWKWRHGNQEAFIIRTYMQYAGEYGDRCPNPFDINEELIFTQNAAEERFEELKGSQDPDGMGIEFIVEILKFHPFRGQEDILERLQVTDYDMLMEYINNSPDTIDSDSYAPPIPEGHIIIDLYHKQHGATGQFNGAHYPAKSSYWFGNFRVESEITTADLSAFKDTSPSTYQTHMSIPDAVEAYREKVIKALNLTKDEAIEAGVDAYLIEELYNLDQQDE